MKTCFKCRRELPLSDFYAHPQMGDGHLNKCRVCTRRDVQENYAKRRPQYLEYEKRRHGPQRVASIKASRERHPDHDSARYQLNRAIDRGEITRGPCEVCGDPKTDGHHDDYSKPLAVRWRCRKHHMELHRLERSA